MDVNDAIEAIETRVGINSQAMLLEVAADLTLTIGCVIDPTLLTFSILENVERFNEETNNIFFQGGRLVPGGSDNTLFALTFTVQKCNGGM